MSSKSNSDLFVIGLSGFRLTPELYVNSLSSEVIKESFLALASDKALRSELSSALSGVSFAIKPIEPESVVAEGDDKNNTVNEFCVSCSGLTESVGKIVGDFVSQKFGVEDFKKTSDSVVSVTISKKKVNEIFAPALVKQIQLRAKGELSSWELPYITSSKKPSLYDMMYNILNSTTMPVSISNSTDMRIRVSMKNDLYKDFFLQDKIDLDLLCDINDMHERHDILSYAKIIEIIKLTETDASQDTITEAVISKMIMDSMGFSVATSMVDAPVDEKLKQSLLHVLYYCNILGTRTSRAMDHILGSHSASKITNYIVENLSQKWVKIGQFTPNQTLNLSMLDTCVTWDLKGMKNALLIEQYIKGAVSRYKSTLEEKKVSTEKLEDEIIAEELKFLSGADDKNANEDKSTLKDNVIEEEPELSIVIGQSERLEDISNKVQKEEVKAETELSTDIAKLGLGEAPLTPEEILEIEAEAGVLFEKMKDDARNSMYGLTELGLSLSVLYGLNIISQKYKNSAGEREALLCQTIYLLCEAETKKMIESGIELAMEENKIEELSSETESTVEPTLEVEDNIVEEEPKCEIVIGQPERLEEVIQDKQEEVLVSEIETQAIEEEPKCEIVIGQLERLKDISQESTIEEERAEEKKVEEEIKAEIGNGTEVNLEQSAFRTIKYVNEHANENENEKPIPFNTNKIVLRCSTDMDSDSYRRRNAIDPMFLLANSPSKVGTLEREPVDKDIALLTIDEISNALQEMKSDPDYRSDKLYSRIDFFREAKKPPLERASRIIASTEPERRHRYSEVNYQVGASR